MKQRRSTDRDFFVYLFDKDTEKRQAVGSFYGESAGEAVDNARKHYRGLFSGMQTKKWELRAYEIKGARRVVQES